MIFKKILVFVHGEKGYIWSADEAARLGHEYNIVGQAVGALSEFRNKNSVLGLLIQLSLENVIQAVCKGWVNTVRFESNYFYSKTHISKFKKLDHEQIVINRQKYLRSMLASINMDDKTNLEIVREKTKLMFPKLRTSYSWKINKTSQIFNTYQFLNKSKTSKRQISVKLAPSSLHIFTHNIVWPLSLSKKQRARCAIVFDLQSSGYFVTDGTKFGGDFLVYPGNPVLYHARFVMNVLNADSTLTSNILIAQARVSHTTRKHMILSITSEKTLTIEGNRSKYSRSNQAKIFFDQTLRSIRIGNHIVSIKYIKISPILTF